MDSEKEIKIICKNCGSDKFCKYMSEEDYEILSTKSEPHKIRTNQVSNKFDAPNYFAVERYDCSSCRTELNLNN